MSRSYRSYTNNPLATAMEAAGLNAKGLARKVGVSTPSVYNWLRGRAPGLEVRHKVAEALSMDVEQLAPVPNGTNGTEHGPISVKVNGSGLSLEMMVSKETARKVLHQLLNE